MIYSTLTCALQHCTTFCFLHCTKTPFLCALFVIPHCTKNTLVLCTHHNWHSALHVVFLNSPEQRLCTCSYWASFMKRNSCLPLCYLSFSDQVERTLRVRGDLHIGGVMIHLVDSLGKSVPNQTSFCSTSDKKQSNSFVYFFLWTATFLIAAK